MTNFLSIPKNFKFGFEIEFCMYNWEKKVVEFMQFVQKELYYKDYSMSEDITIVKEINEYGGYDPPYYGAEIQTPILENTIHAWEDLSKICRFIKENGGNINERCSLHINIGVDYLGYNYKYWYNFLKIFCACEPEIYRYMCGEDSIRYCAIGGMFHQKFAMPIFGKIKDGLNKCHDNDLNELLCNCFYYDNITLDCLKYNSVSFEALFESLFKNRKYVRKIKEEKLFKKNIYGMRIEFRMSNGTLDVEEMKKRLYCIYRVLKTAKIISDSKMKIVDELIIRDLLKVDYNNYFSILYAQEVANVLFTTQNEKDDFIVTCLKPNIKY